MLPWIVENATPSATTLLRKRKAAAAKMSQDQQKCINNSQYSRQFSRRWRREILQQPYIKDIPQNTPQTASTYQVEPVTPCKDSALELNPQNIGRLKACLETYLKSEDFHPIDNPSDKISFSIIPIKHPIKSTLFTYSEPKNRRDCFSRTKAESCQLWVPAKQQKSFKGSERTQRNNTLYQCRKKQRKGPTRKNENPLSKDRQSNQRGLGIWQSQTSKQSKDPLFKNIESKLNQLMEPKRPSVHILTLKESTTLQFSVHSRRSPMLYKKIPLLEIA